MKSLAAFHPLLPVLCAGAFAALPTAVRAAAGDVDPGFQPNPNNNMSSALMQPDGAMVLLGNFSSVAGVPRSFLARLSTGGVVDPGFSAGAAGGSGFTNPGVFCGAMQADGRIVIGGLFAFVNGVSRGFIARLNANGTLDTGYPAAAGDQIRGIAIQPDGKVVAVGYFTSMNSTVRNRVARLHTDGLLDTGFNPNANAVTRSVALQPDGKIILGGSFTAVGGVTRNHVARVQADGTLDMAFNPNVSGDVYSIALQSDGKIILGGTFATVGSTPRSNIARLNADGTLDTGFNPGANDNVRTSTIQANGQIVIGGEFSSIGATSRSRVARLLSNGALDAGFNPGAGDDVMGMTLQADGRVGVSGLFDTLGGATRNNFGRLLNDPATESLTVTGPSRVEWMRGGTSPETHAVTLEVSTGDGPWSAPVAGTRIAGGWEFTGLSLPDSGQMRARARTAGGYNNGTAGLVESSTSFILYTPLQSWRQTHFGSPDNSGPGADNADPDKDGAENAMEYAFDLNPNLPDATLLPAWQLNDDDLVLTFTQPANVSGVSYLVEQSTALAPGTWTAIVNSSVPPLHTYYVPPTAGSRRFLRLLVTVP